MGTDKAEIILRHYPDINAFWLLTGKGNMLYKKEDLEIPDRNITIPLLSEKHLKNPLYKHKKFHQFALDFYAIPCIINADFAIKINSGGITAVCNNGDYITCKLIRKDGFIQWGRVHLIATKEQGIIVTRLKKAKKEDCFVVENTKKYDSFCLTPDNIVNLALVTGTIKHV